METGYLTTPALGKWIDTLKSFFFSSIQAPPPPLWRLLNHFSVRGLFLPFYLFSSAKLAILRRLFVASGRGTREDSRMAAELIC
jgi:hypothetical protein